MSTKGPSGKQITEKQLFMSIMRNKDKNAKKLIISQLNPEQQGRFIVFYKGMMAKAQEARKIRADIERLEQQKVEILHQNAQVLAKDLDSIYAPDNKAPTKGSTRPNI